jgi:uncharacterized protein YgiM (DUF1202 family)
MKKKIVSLMAVAMILVLIIPTVAFATYTRYVYTKNGGTLKIRYAPSTNAEVLTSVDFGTKLTCIADVGGGWTEIYWGGDDRFYVMTKFLSKTKRAKPEKQPKATATPVPVAGPTAAPAAAPVAAGIAEMNRIFKSFKSVREPYIVTVRPTRATAVVNVRFAPSRSAEVLFRAPDGKQLSVIGELDGWLQVQDPDTHSVGYITTELTVQ